MLKPLLRAAWVLAPACLLGLTLTVGAAEPEDAPPAAVRVVAVRPGALLELADGTRLRLSGILVPPAQADAASALAKELVRAPAEVLIEPEALARDRHGRVRAQVTLRDGTSLQDRLLAAGLALVASEPGAARHAARMLQVEDRARSAGRGLWGRSDAPVFEVGGREPPVGSFAIVRGRVLAVGESRAHIYLNFDDEWWRDFTLRIRRPELEEVLGRSGAEGFVGRLVEARGVVMAAGGPLIELSHPEQIEVLE